MSFQCFQTLSLVINCKNYLYFSQIKLVSFCFNCLYLFVSLNYALFKITVDTCTTSLCSSPLRARAFAVYGLCNKRKFPVREEVSGQRGQMKDILRNVVTFENIPLFLRKLGQLTGYKLYLCCKQINYLSFKLLQSFGG